MTSTTTDLDTLAVNTIRGLPLKQLLTKFGFTPEQVAQAARERVAAARDGRA